MIDQPTRAGAGLLPSRRAASHPAPRERISLDPSSPYWAEHRSRYLFASTFAGDKEVLDIACGSGMAFSILSPVARRVVGADISLEALLECRSHFETEAPVCQADGTVLPFADCTFDLVTSFETIEHVVDDDGFVRELRRVLKADGELILSTPNALFTKPVNGVPSNPFHMREYLPRELASLLEQHFSRVSVMRQRTTDTYGICPYWHENDLIPRDASTRARVLIWKLERRLPTRIRDWLSERVQGRSFYPTETDFTVTAAGRDGHVLVALCHP